MLIAWKMPSSFELWQRATCDELRPGPGSRYFSGQLKGRIDQTRKTEVAQRHEKHMDKKKLSSKWAKDKMTRQLITCSYIFNDLQPHRYLSISYFNQYLTRDISWLEASPCQGVVGSETGRTSIRFRRRHAALAQKTLDRCGELDCPVEFVSSWVYIHRVYTYQVFSLKRKYMFRNT